MFNLASLAIFLLTLFATANPDLTQSVVLEAGDDNAVTLSGSLSLTVGGEEDDQQIDLYKIESIPKVWIGVRVSTVPDALAAHLKRGYLMIVNVAENSPADHAGIERYDVVLSFNDRDIDDMKDLLEAIRENGPDNTAKSIVIQGGEEKTLTITPIQRDLAVTPTFKYEEQEAAQVDPLKKYFGHRFKIGPDGHMLVTPHGRLDQLPDDIMIMIDKIPDFDMHSFDDSFFRFNIDIDDFHEQFFADEDGDESSAITITITEDGESLSIQRDKDGTFTVERRDADGSRSSNTYDDADQFREEDPDAFKTYKRSKRGHGLSTFIVTPDFKNLGAKQQQFQIELKTQLDKAHAQVDHANRVVEKARQAHAKAKVHRYKIKRDNEKSGTHSKAVSLIIDNGYITLTITEDGVTREYQFDSRDDFKNTEPQLYKHYKQHLDSAD